jgi:hypothetical protein
MSRRGAASPRRGGWPAFFKSMDASHLPAEQRIPPKDPRAELMDTAARLAEEDREREARTEQDAEEEPQ